MRVCIGGRNNIAVSVCEYIQTVIPVDCIFAIPGKTDDGRDGYQRSFLKYAQKENITVVKLEDIYDWEDLLFLSLEFDRIIDPTKFKSKRLFNIHFSLLPAYKGVYTSAIPILNGEKFAGVTLHAIDQGIDTGDIIEQVKFAISPYDRAIDLYRRCINEGTNMVIKCFSELLDGIASLAPQSAIGSSYYSKCAIDYSNLNVDLKATACQIDRQIRAYNYRPFQLPKVDNTPIFFTEITPDRSTKKQGTIIEKNSDYIRVATIDYDILLFVDHLDDVLECCKTNDLQRLHLIPQLCRYINEHEKIHGWTPLIVAAYYNSIDVVKYLVELGADVNCRNYNGTTAIMYAKDGSIATGSYDTVDYLLTNGADPNIGDYSDKNLFDYIDSSMPVWEHVLRYKQ